MSLWPSKKQWQSWTLPSKLTAIGVLVSLLAILLTIGLFAVNYFSGPNLADIVRPYVIFDAITIHKDGGAMEYLEEIEVEVTGQVYENANPEEKHDSQSSTTGRAGGMRKAPKRGRYVALSSSCSWSF